jgi:hypothetical protein
MALFAEVRHMWSKNIIAKLSRFTQGLVRCNAGPTRKGRAVYECFEHDVGRNRLAPSDTR